MKKKISIVLSVALCLSCTSFAIAQEQQVEKEHSRYYAKAVDPDPDITTFPRAEQDAKYKELPEEQEKVAIIPGVADLEPDHASIKIVPEGDPDIAIQPPQASR